jgi:predicted transcriptional regulator
MTDMHPHSLTTYDAILETLPASRAAVMAAIREHQPVTRQDLADKMGWPINRVTGRVRELLDCSAVKEQGVKYSETLKPRAQLWINVPA